MCTWFKKNVGIKQILTWSDLLGRDLSFYSIYQICYISVVKSRRCFKISREREKCWCSLRIELGIEKFAMLIKKNGEKKKDGRNRIKSVKNQNAWRKTKIGNAKIWGNLDMVTRESGSLLTVTQNNAERNNYIKMKIDNMQPNSKCSLWGDKMKRLIT